MPDVVRCQLIIDSLRGETYDDHVPDAPNNDILLYTSPDGTVELELRLENDTLWMTQQMMADLFQTSAPNINVHIKNILQENELQEHGTIKENLIVRQEGSRRVRRKVLFYNLDMIISVGYRVNSVRVRAIIVSPAKVAFHGVRGVV